MTDRLEAISKAVRVLTDALTHAARLRDQRDAYATYQDPFVPVPLGGYVNDYGRAGPVVKVLVSKHNILHTHDIRITEADMESCKAITALSEVYGR